MRRTGDDRPYTLVGSTGKSRRKRQHSQTHPASSSGAQAGTRSGSQAGGKRAAGETAVPAQQLAVAGAQLGQPAVLSLAQLEGLFGIIRQIMEASAAGANWRGGHGAEFSEPPHLPSSSRSGWERDSRIRGQWGERWAVLAEQDEVGLRGRRAMQCRTMCQEQR